MGGSDSRLGLRSEINERPCAECQTSRFPNITPFYPGCGEKRPRKYLTEKEHATSSSSRARYRIAGYSALPGIRKIRENSLWLDSRQVRFTPVETKQPKDIIQERTTTGHSEVGDDAGQRSARGGGNMARSQVIRGRFVIVTAQSSSRRRGFSPALMLALSAKFSRALSHTWRILLE